MDINEALAGSIPSEIVQRCRGKQTPVNPHAQRLLVAATKDAKSIKGKGKDSKEKKEKPKGPTGDRLESKVAKERAPRKPPAEGDRSKTPYALAKDLFVDGFLDCTFAASMYMMEYQSSLNDIL